MAKTRGDAMVRADPTLDERSTAQVEPTVAPAQRGSRPVWRDPRLWVGVVVVAASVVAGARLFAAADDTVQVWAAASDMGAGQTVGAGDLVAERVHFGDGDAQAAYFLVDETLPGDLQLTRTVGSGELLARSAVGTATTSGLLEVPIAVDPEQVPASVAAGAVVDVYVITSATAAAADPTAGTAADPTVGARSLKPALSAATVVDAPPLSSSFGATGKRQLVVAVKDAQAQAFFALLARDDDPVLTVVRRG